MDNQPKEKPVKYIVEFYEKSFGNDPAYVVTTTTPIASLNVGDLLYLGTWWPGSLLRGDHGRITALRHNIYDIAKEHATHQIGVCFVPVDKSKVP